MWLRRKVKSGQQIGRKISSPTLNFNVGTFGKSYPHGVYGAYLKIAGKDYKGALYFGPKLAGKKPVLEVFVFGKGFGSGVNILLFVFKVALCVGASNE